ncbi:MAG TPA: endonuclease III [Phycisphaerae bacterium]|jgi:endonuclease-3|nr:endonuclease III [Phycisphaerae bacterium]
MPTVARRGTPKPSPSTGKEPFDIHKAIQLLRAAVEPFPAAAMFELKSRGFGTLFQQLVACVLSIRTFDEVSLPAALALLQKAATPKEMFAFSETQIDQLIRTVTFHQAKARTIRNLAQTTLEKFHGTLPCDREALLELPGIGPKCASLALGIACNQPHISVDIHVHRVTNRWGYVAAGTPEKTMLALMEQLPEKYWIELNRLLVPFGKHICTGTAPKCSTCPLLSMCRQVGVTTHR